MHLRCLYSIKINRVRIYPLRTTVYDHWNNAIYLTDERWEHILEFHQEMADFHDEILTTLKRGKRRQDPLDPALYTYFHFFDHLPGDNTHIVVVVKFSSQSTDAEQSSNNFVLTSFPKTIYSQR